MQNFHSELLPLWKGIEGKSRVLDSSCLMCRQNREEESVKGYSCGSTYA